ncbi:MAG TPA: LptA/OstA family protein [Candidatus Binatia bacterium]|nr:LptA/OstA family protein [Candidatus Binatia bacterium]
MIRFTSALAGALALVTPLALAAPPRSPAPQRSPAAQRSPGARARSPVPSAAASPPGGQASFDLGVWTVHASSIDANFKSGDFSTPAKIVMTRVGGDVSADRAKGNYKKQMLYLNGHVVMHDSQGNGLSSLEGGAPSQSAGPSTLTADQAQIDGAAKVYKAIGSVHYVQADTVVDADTGTLDDANHSLLLEGAVHITQGARSMNARKVLYNTETGSAHAEGDVTMQFPNEVHRGIATPRPLKIPKNGLTQPAGSPSAKP